MAARKWHKGPPPHVGWWNASTSGNERAWRWWNGSVWSQPVWPWMAPHEAARSAAVEETDKLPIKWTCYWPESARMPRIDPTQL